MPVDRTAASSHVDDDDLVGLCGDVALIDRGQGKKRAPRFAIHVVDNNDDGEVWPPIGGACPAL